MVALLQPLPTEATIVEKTNTCTDRRHSTYHLRPQIIEENLDSFVKTCHIIDGKEETGKSRMGGGHWVSDVYSNRSKLRLIETEKAVSSRLRGFDIMSFALLLKQWTFPILK